MSPDRVINKHVEEPWSLELGGPVEAVGTNCEQVRVEESGILYSTCSDVPYRSVNYHRSSSGTSKPKNIWAIDRNSEVSVFCEATQNSWDSPDGNRWSVCEDGSSPFGTKGERLAHFPHPANPGDAWHGYPVSRKGSNAFPKGPPDDLVTKWKDEGRISFADSQRILRKKL